MAATGNQDEVSEWDELKVETRDALYEVREKLKEINLLYEQSQVEVSKLAQRNAAVTVRLGQLQANFDTVPREDIRKYYDLSLDAQQRLFVMRGQLEKLQSDQAHLNRQAELLEIISGLLGRGPSQAGGGGNHSTNVETLEMLVQAQEAERQRLSRQMHDGPAQSLSNFILQTEIALRLLDLDQDKAREELANLKQSATAAFQKVRDFIFELRPMMLDDLGVVPTLKRYIQAFQDQAGLEVRLAVLGTERRLEPFLEVMVFRAIQELLANAAHHSQAKQVKVQLDVADTYVRAVVEDDGSGFDLETMSRRGGVGLQMIKDRVEMLGGQFEVDSVIGQGARISLQVPLRNGS